jgi:hypothetical protein
MISAGSEASTATRSGSGLAPSMSSSPSSQPGTLPPAATRINRDAAIWVADGVDDGCVVAVSEHCVGAGVVDRVRELGAGEAEVQRHEHRSEVGRGEQGLQDRRVVEAEVGNPVALANASVAQDLRQASDPVLDLGEGQRAAEEGHSGAFGGGSGPALQQRSQVDLGRGGRQVREVGAREPCRLGGLSAHKA